MSAAKYDRRPRLAENAYRLSVAANAAIVKAIYDAHGSDIDLEVDCSKIVRECLENPRITKHHVARARKQHGLKYTYSRSIEGTKLQKLLNHPGLYTENVAILADEIGCTESYLRGVKLAHRSGYEVNFINDRFRQWGIL